MIIKREISITETELDILIELLHKEEKRCVLAANATQQGFKKAESSEKYAKWDQRAADSRALSEKLSQRFL